MRLFRAAGEVSFRVAWRALWTSRVVVWLAGVLGVLSLGNARGYRSFDPSRLTAPFGYFGNLVVSPLARWDSVWYLAIAHTGYGHQPARTAFFPLYPLAIRVVGVVLGSDLVAGVVVSLVCFAIGLAVLYRLVALELDDERARLTVMLIAFCPMSYFFSAVYSESMFLALSVSCIYAARSGRWGVAGILGGLAAASRNSGVALAVPIVVLYLYGPRADRPLACSRSGSAAVLDGSRQRLRRLLPVHPIRPSLAWVLLVPAGLGTYILWLAVTSGDGLAPFRAQEVWFRHFAGPFGGIWDGAVAAWDGLRQLIHGLPPPVYFTKAAGNPLTVAGQNLMLFGFLVLGAIACAGAFRKLPAAYGAYALAALAFPLSYPVGPQPLASLPRYEVVLFPLFMWASGWLVRKRLATEGIAALAVLLGLFTVQFATWRFVA